MINTVSLGRVHTIRVREREDGLYSLTVYIADEDSPTLVVTEDALRALWAHLTKLLYPRAGDQLTERIPTAKRVRDGIDHDVTFSMTAYAEIPDDIIILSGVSRDRSWVMEISTAAGEDLWTSLEDLLDAV